MTYQTYHFYCSFYHRFVKCSNIHQFRMAYHSQLHFHSISINIIEIRCNKQNIRKRNIVSIRQSCDRLQDKQKLSFHV